MKKLFSLIAVAAIALQVNGQDASVKAIQSSANTAVSTDTSYKPNKKGWTKGLTLNISATQIGNSNWIAAGGDEFSLSGLVAINAFASRKWGRQSWDNILDVNYALVNTSTLGVRKVNDRLDFITKYGYKPKKWKNTSYSILGQLRSQLASGYQYDYLGTTEKRRNSGFLHQPISFLLQVGIGNPIVGSLSSVLL